MQIIAKALCVWSVHLALALQVVCIREGSEPPRPASPGKRKPMEWFFQGWDFWNPKGKKDN